MEKLIKMYLDYVNNFLTTERFAEWHGLDEKDAKTLIQLGKKYHELKVDLLTTN